MICTPETLRMLCDLLLKDKPNMTVKEFIEGFHFVCIYK